MVTSVFPTSGLPRTPPHDTLVQLFSDPDTSLTESTRAAGAAGVLLLMTFVYCLGYPVVKAFRRAKEAREMGNSVDDRDRDLESREEMPAEEVPARRLVVGDNGR